MTKMPKLNFFFLETVLRLYYDLRSKDLNANLQPEITSGTQEKNKITTWPLWDTYRGHASISLLLVATRSEPSNAADHRPNRKGIPAGGHHMQQNTTFLKNSSRSGGGKASPSRQSSWIRPRIREEGFAPTSGCRLHGEGDASPVFLFQSGKCWNPQWGPRMEVEEGACQNWMSKVACVCHQET